eukprot:gene9334-10319_t
MADGQDLQPIDNEDPEITPGYKAPAQKSLQEIQQQDQDDESLVRYKQTLLAGLQATGPADDPRKVIVQKMIFVSEGREDISFDLTGDLAALKKTTFVIKEGVEYRLKIIFKIQHEIVSGLLFHQVITKKGIRVAKQSNMVGSYGPKVESQEYTSPPEEAPKGLLARGHYQVKSKFMDDDKVVHLQWEWGFDIKKEWE